MRRFTALAIDNIRAIRSVPHGVGQRAGRVSSPAAPTGSAQFGWFENLLAAAPRSIVYLTLALAGLVVAIAEDAPVHDPHAHRLLALTICFVLINARYSMTVQPFVFVLVAVALVELSDRWSARRSSRNRHDLAT
jgi:hypothetical protein